MCLFGRFDLFDQLRLFVRLCLFGPLCLFDLYYQLDLSQKNLHQLDLYYLLVLEGQWLQ